jgi:hypothetical protein
MALTRAFKQTVRAHVQYGKGGQSKISVKREVRTRKKLH